ncbi:TOBE domain-containing protein [Undibacterium sp. Jales W-56]|uniref:TOBE domain-containing protein n=1 Tax=Undibacterium sp. Jales W-56 TaxID=2897325 RepID=UPI0021CEAEDA|nr:TOBE domain-containing protein [Undibacterium sp. Jales W-56]MCU6435855.1 TOBE domain-containing protein [Undibacterium sp. Jales W-56]
MNKFSGQILAIEAYGSVAIIDVAVGAHRFTATLMGAADQLDIWKSGQPVCLLFKETEVALAKNLSGQISLRNRMPSIITALEHGQLLTRVAMQMDGLPLFSVITTRSARNLQLAVGDQVEGLVKSNEMSLLADAQDGAV